jgi:hypothetical protein
MLSASVPLFSSLAGPTIDVVRGTESTFLVLGADKDPVPIVAEAIAELVTRVYEPGSIPTT